MPRGRDVDAIRKAWDTTRAPEPAPAPSSESQAAAQRARERAERLKAIKVPDGAADSTTQSDRQRRVDQLAGPKAPISGVIDPLRAIKTAADLAAEEKRRGGRSL